MTNKEIKIEFAPGCFDNFDGTQEELDDLVAEITALAESGEIFEQMKDLDEEDIENLPPEILDSIFAAVVEDENELQRIIANAQRKTLH